MLGINFGIGNGIITGKIGSWSPAELFRNSEEGAWYDPSDFSTLYQDSTGTTPVTALGQPVGLMQDKSGNGNHASQATSAARPTVQARVNLITRSEEIGVSPWGVTTGANAITITADQAVAPDGQTTADELSRTTVGTDIFPNTFINISVTSGLQYTYSFYAKQNGSKYVSTAFGNTGFSSSTNAPVFDLDAGTVVSGTGTIESIGDGWYRLSATATANSTATGGPNIRLNDENGVWGTGSSYAGTESIYVWGAQLEQGSTATTYQRVTTATDYEDIGLPRYLEFDGVDDHMGAGAAGDWNYLHDGTGATVVAGLIPVVSNTTNNCILSTYSSATTQVGFRVDLFQPSDAWFLAAARGVSGSLAINLSAPGGTVSPPTDPYVLSVIHGSAQTPDVVLRQDATLVASQDYQNTPSTANSTAQLFLARLSTGLNDANSRIHQLVIRNTLTAGAELNNLERYVARKTGVSL